MSVGMTRCSEPQPRKGSQLGGYETPPPANDVPEHLFDIILGRPTDRGVTIRVLAYENLVGRIGFRSATGPTSGVTSAVSLKKGVPADFVMDSLEVDTLYHYRFEFRAEGKESLQQSDPYSLHTQRRRDSSFTFTVQSDSHLDENTSPAVYQRTLANVLHDGPDFHF